MRQTIGKFLDRYHSPTAVLAAPGADICRTITSVGLQACAGVLFSLSLSLSLSLESNLLFKNKEPDRPLLVQTCACLWCWRPRR